LRIADGRKATTAIKIQVVFTRFDGHCSLLCRIAHPIQSLRLGLWHPVVPPSAILFLMSLCQFAHDKRPGRASRGPGAFRKNATPKRTQASRLSQIAKCQIYKPDPRANRSDSARATPLKPEKRTHQTGSSRIPIPPSPHAKKTRNTTAIFA
jgi:hypothetical protein